MAVHQRLYVERGPARAFACVLCTNPAHEWAYDGCDPDAVRGNTAYGSGYEVSYSTKSEHYHGGVFAVGHRRPARRARRQAAPEWGETVRQAALHIGPDGCECLRCHTVWEPARFVFLAKLLNYDKPVGVLE